MAWEVGHFGPDGLGGLDPRGTPFPQLGAKFKFKGLNFGLDGPCGDGHMIILVFVSLRMYIELYAAFEYYFGQHPDGARIWEIKSKAKRYHMLLKTMGEPPIGPCSQNCNSSNCPNLQAILWA